MSRSISSCSSHLSFPSPSQNNHFKFDDTEKMEDSKSVNDNISLSQNSQQHIKHSRRELKRKKVKDYTIFAFREKFKRNKIINDRLRRFSAETPRSFKNNIN